MSSKARDVTIGNRIRFGTGGIKEVREIFSLDNRIRFRSDKGESVTHYTQEPVRIYPNLSSV